MNISSIIVIIKGLVHFLWICILNSTSPLLFKAEFCSPISTAFQASFAEFCSSITIPFHHHYHQGLSSFVVDLHWEFYIAAPVSVWILFSITTPFKDSFSRSLSFSQAHACRVVADYSSLSHTPSIILDNLYNTFLLTIAHSSGQWNQPQCWGSEDQSNCLLHSHNHHKQFCFVDPQPSN